MSNIHVLNVAGARRHGNELASVAPQTLTRDERVLQTGARHGLELEITKALILGGSKKLHRDLRTRHTFIIRRQCHRHAVPAVERERVVGALDAEDLIVADQGDLDQHVAARHLGQESERIVLVEDVDAVADAPGMSALDGRRGSLVVTGIRVQNEFDDDGSTAAPFVALGTEESGDAGEDAIVPALYAMDSHGDWRFGLGVNVPFGLSTKYEDDWIGRFAAIDSDVKSVNVNPALSYRLNQYFSLGAGIQLQHIDARLTNATLTAAGFEVDYVELVDAVTLSLDCTDDHPRRLVAAARMGSTRLIDNIAVTDLS